MDFVNVDRSNIDILYDLNVQLAADEDQKDLFTASRSSYRNAFSGSHPVSFGVLAFINAEPAGFYIYCFKFATYPGANVLYIEDIYLTEKHRSSENKIHLLNHAVEQAASGQCCRVEMRVLKSFNIGYEEIEARGFNRIDKWDVYRLEQGGGL